MDGLNDWKGSFKYSKFKNLLNRWSGTKNLDQPLSVIQKQYKYKVGLQNIFPGRHLK